MSAGSIPPAPDASPLETLRPPPSTRPGLVPRLVRENRAFRSFWAGQAVSLFGDQVTLIALPLVAVLVLRVEAAQMGFLTAAGLVPNLLFSIHAGAWIDRAGRRRRMMIVADLGRAALVATLPIAYAMDALTLTHLYVVAFATGTLSVLFYVSYGTLFVSVVPSERYVEANSILNGTRALSTVAGPSVGGILVQAFRAPFALVADAASFLLSAAFLTRVRVPEPPTEEEASGAISAGVRFIRSSAVMRAALGATATLNFFNFVFHALFLLYAVRSLGLSAGTIGLVLGAASIGAVMGAMLTPRIVRRIGIGPTFVVGCIVFPAPLLLVPLAVGPTPLVLAALFVAEFGSGFGVMMLDIGGATIFAAIVPDRMRARVTGAYRTVNYGIRPVGSIAGGSLGSLLGLRAGLWIGAAGALAGILWLLRSPLPRMRDLPAPD